MESPTAEWREGPMPPTPKLESVSPRFDEASAEKHSDCTWSPQKANQTVTAWPNNGNLDAKVQQIPEPQVGGVPRSVLQRLLELPCVPGSPLRSPRRRCSAASASMVAMVHSPRAFARSDDSSYEKRDPTAQTAPYHWCTPMLLATEYGSYGSSSNCSSQCSSPIPISTFPDHPVPSDDEEDDVIMLRQQVALLVKSLEDEKKRRASEQHLMQKKIIELQSLIRGNGHVDDDDVEFIGKTPSAQMGFSLTQENERPESNHIRRWSAPVCEDERVACDCLHKHKETSGEAAAKVQLTRLRARMHAIAIDSQRESQTLRVQLEGMTQSQNQRVKQLALENTIKVAALEQKHAATTSRLAQQIANSAAQVEKLESEKLDLLACMQAQQKRLKQLELALGGKQIVDNSR